MGCGATKQRQRNGGAPGGSSPDEGVALPDAAESSRSCIDEVLPANALDPRPGWHGGVGDADAVVTPVSLRPPRVQLLIGRGDRVDGAFFGRAALGTATNLEPPPASALTTAAASPNAAMASGGSESFPATTAGDALPAAQRGVDAAPAAAKADDGDDTPPRCPSPSSGRYIVDPAARVTRIRGSLAVGDPAGGDGAGPVTVSVASLGFDAFVSGEIVSTAVVGRPTAHTFELAAPAGRFICAVRVRHAPGRGIIAIGAAEVAPLDVL